MVFAKTSKAASRLSEQIRQNSWKKQYVTVVDSVPSPDKDALEDFLLKDSQTNMVSVSKKHIRGAKKAVLKYETILKKKDRAMLRIFLVTGRSHQIRVQLSSRGWPIVNDHKYNKKYNKNEDIALWAEKIEIIHPITGEAIVFLAEIPEKIVRLLS